MDPITKSIDALESLLGHSPHLAIVAVPLGAFAVSATSDALAMTTGCERFDAAAEISMAVGLVGTVAAAATGLRDYGKIPASRQPSHRIATTHGLGNLAVAGLLATSYGLRVASRRRHERPSTTARLLCLAGAGLSLYTGWLGGKLVSELGEAVKPVQKRRLEADSDADSQPLGGDVARREQALRAATGSIPTGR